MAINKVEANGQTLIDLTNDTAEAEDVLEGQTFHLRSGAVATGTYRPSDEIVARLEATVGHSGKNYISYDTSTYTYTANGITFTLDPSAGTVTANGTATANTEFRIPFNHITTISGNVVYAKKPIKSGKYYFCGSPSGGTSTSYWCFVYDNTTGSGAKKWDGTSGISRDYGDVHKNEVLIDDTHSQRFTILIANGYTASNVVFRPMIWSGDIDDDTFEPYIEPTDSQIETKTRAYLTSTVGHVGKNQLSFGSQNLTKVIAGVTFTVDPSTGTVTANGTSTSSSGSQYNIRITGNQVPAAVSNYSSRSIPNGKYYFCGCPSGGTTSGTQTYNVYIYDHTAGARAKRWNGSTNADTDIGVTTKNELLINDQSHTLSYNIRVFDTNGQNKVFRPMIWSGDIKDDIFEPYQIPTDEAKQDKPVMLYDAGESSVGVHSVTGLSNLTQYSELHITLFAPVSGNEPDTGYTHTIVYPFISNNPANQAAGFDCWITVLIDGSEIQKRVGIGIQSTNTTVEILGELNEQDGGIDNIPSNHYIYIKRIVGIPK